MRSRKAGLPNRYRRHIRRGLAPQAVEPLAAHRTHPARGSWNRVGDDVEQRADTHGHGAMAIGQRFGDPLLLLRYAERDQQDVGLPPLQLIEGAFLPFGAEIAVPEDPVFVAGVERPEALCRLAGNSGPRAIKADLEPPRRRLQHRRHEIGSVQIGAKRPSVKDPRGKIDANPVGEHGKVAQLSPELGIAGCHIGVVSIEKRDRGVGACGDTAMHEIQRVGVRDIMHANSEYVARDLGSRLPGRLQHRIPTRRPKRGISPLTLWTDQ